MSWPELERLVADAEADPSLRRALCRCRTRRELILMARRLVYRLSRLDLQRAASKQQVGLLPEDAVGMNLPRPEAAAPAQPLRHWTCQAQPP